MAKMFLTMIQNSTPKGLRAYNGLLNAIGSRIPGVRVMDERVSWVPLGVTGLYTR